MAKTSPVGPDVGSRNPQRPGVQQLDVRTQRILLPVVGAILCISLGWTLWLIMLTIFPNDTINFVMSTQAFDDGSFWAIIESPVEVVALGVTGLVIVMIGYLFVAVKVISWGKRAIVPVQLDASASECSYCPPKICFDASSSPFQAKRSTPQATVVHPRSLGPKMPLTNNVSNKILSDLTQESSPTRKHANVLLKLGNLGIQLAALCLILEAGYPIILVRVLAAFVALNSLACVFIIYTPRKLSRLAEDLVDFMFDLGVAIVFPMLVLVYCRASFDFDRKAFAINTELLPVGDFSRNARMFSDPTETAIIYKSFNALRIHSVLDFFTRVGANLVLCYRFHCVVALLQDPRRHQASMYPRKHPIAIVFVVFTLATVAFVEASIYHSHEACLLYPECPLYAHRWSSSSQGHCPCLVLIDCIRAPQTFDEWLHPRNVTDKVAQLAASGDLQIIQLVNRLLPTFPEELRGCVGLQYLSLMYSGIQSVPSWAKELTKLEFLHIEGKPGFPGLVALPEDLFDDMERLTFMHLAVHEDLTRFPSFQGLINLRSLTLAMLGSLTELPELTHQKNLQTLTLLMAPMVQILPDLAPVSNTLQQLVILGRGTFCCNGFLDNRCDLSNALCQTDGVLGSPPATCLPVNRSDRLATAATIQMMKKFETSTCIPPSNPPATGTPIIQTFTTEANVFACNGTMYRECAKPTSNQHGMCVNVLFLPIACNGDDAQIEVRRRQIQQGVGTRCDPQYEAWLGCLKR